jgi:hypothetical protein
MGATAVAAPAYQACHLGLCDSSCESLPCSDDEAEGCGQVWELLDCFAGVELFEYSALITRHPAEYHATMHLLHQRLAEKFDRRNYAAVIVLKVET